MPQLLGVVSRSSVAGLPFAPSPSRQRLIKNRDDCVPGEEGACPSPSGAVGPSAYRRQVERFLTGLPDLRFDVDDTITEKDKLVVYWTITGTHRGEFLGVPATNKKVSFSGITINQIRDGKIIESTVIWDGLGLLEQFGIELPVRYEMLAASAR